MTTLKERAFWHSLKIRSKPFIGETRRKRIFDKYRKSMEKDPGLDIDLICITSDERFDYDIKRNNELKLGDIIMAKQGLDLRRVLMLYPEEREVMHRYGLNIDEITSYRDVANDILLDGDEDILGGLNIPQDNPSKVPYAYKRVLYYIAERCINGRDISANFFNSIS